MKKFKVKTMVHVKGKSGKFCDHNRCKHFLFDEEYPICSLFGDGIRILSEDMDGLLYHREEGCINAEKETKKEGMKHD